MEEEILNYSPPVMFRGTPCSNVGKLIFIYLLNYIEKNVKHRNNFRFLIQCVLRNMAVGE